MNMCLQNLETFEELKIRLTPEMNCPNCGDFMDWRYQKSNFYCEGCNEFHDLSEPYLDF